MARGSTEKVPTLRRDLAVRGPVIAHGGRGGLDRLCGGLDRRIVAIPIAVVLLFAADRQPLGDLLQQVPHLSQQPLRPPLGDEVQVQQMGEGKTPLVLGQIAPVGV